MQQYQFIWIIHKFKKKFFEKKYLQAPTLPHGLKWDRTNNFEKSVQGNILYHNICIQSDLEPNY